MLSNRTAPLPLVRRLTIADLARIVQLQQTVTAELPSGYIFSKSETDFRAYLDGRLGVGYGVFENDTLAASSLLRIPSHAQPNDTPMPFPFVPKQEWPLHVSGLGNMMVLPAARGRGYQRALVDVQRSHAASARMRWMFAGVHFRNAVSWINLLRKGMAIVGMRTDFGYPLIGLLRRVREVPPPVDPVARRSVASHDVSQHQAALQDDYIGVRMAADGSVLYQRLVAADARTFPRVRAACAGAASSHR